MKIFVTHNLPGDCIQKLKSSNHEVLLEESIENAKNSDAVITLLTDRVDADFMDLVGPQLKIISNYAVGFDNVDVKAATDRGIVVTNTPCDEVNVAVAEETIALITNLARRITEADRAVHEGGYKGWEPDIFLGHTLANKNLGIIGMGRIGSMVAKFGKALNMNILYNKTKPDPELEKELNAKFMTLQELLGSSDFISLHAPLTPETHHMINSDSLSKVKKGSFLINTARGQVIDEHALVESLKSGQLAGVALDVFDKEPDINPELLGMENVILTPHIASATYEARNKMGELAISAILDLEKGSQPQNIVNPEVWPNRRH